MQKPSRKHSARLRKYLRRPAQACALGLAATSPLLRNALCTSLACLFAAVAPWPGFAAEAPRPGIGEAYVFNHAADAKTGSAPGQALQSGLRQGTLNVAELLDPSSRIWAGAQALSLRLERASVLLAAQVIASTGDASAAAASHADGRISLIGDGLFGAGNCTSVTMPGNHPAYALALAKEGSVLAAWAQGVNRLVFFDLSPPGCPASITEAAMQGQISLTLSASGAFLAAQDEGGRVWVGPRGGEMRVVATLSGAPAAIGFSDGEGVLLVLDAKGRGGSWNPRSGKGLRTLEVPGGPFARGDFQGAEARLWTEDGRLVRWNVLHNRPADVEKGPAEASTAQGEGWLELQGAELYFVRPGLSWRPEPVYEPRLPQLTHSRHATCLRLSDLDGVVRYFDAHTGRVRSQCFADDWTAVAVEHDGTAQIPGLQLRIFDSLPSPGGNSKVNVRAISETQIVLWTEAAPNLALHVEASPTATEGTLQKAAESPSSSTMGPISVPLRQGIAADAPARPLSLQ